MTIQTRNTETSNIRPPSDTDVDVPRTWLAPVVAQAAAAPCMASAADHLGDTVAAARAAYQRNTPSLHRRIRLSAAVQAGDCKQANDLGRTYVRLARLLADDDAVLALDLLAVGSEGLSI